MRPARRARTGAPAPARPIPNPGWTTERVWKVGADDWEPAIAADPSAPYVYTLSTRYTGPARCPSCPSPSIVLRVSADGGRTWGPDRFLCVCKAIERRAVRPADRGRCGRDGVRRVARGVPARRVGLEVDGPRPDVDHSPSACRPRGRTSPGWPCRRRDRTSTSRTTDPSHGDSFVGVSHDGGASFVTKKITDKNRYFFAGGGWVSADGQHVAFAESDYDQRSARRSTPTWSCRMTAAPRGR